MKMLTVARWATFILFFVMLNVFTSTGEYYLLVFVFLIHQYIQNVEILERYDRKNKKKKHWNRH